MHLQGIQMYDTDSVSEGQMTDLAGNACPGTSESYEL